MMHECFFVYLTVEFDFSGSYLAVGGSDTRCFLKTCKSDLLVQMLYRKLLYLIPPLFGLQGLPSSKC